MDEIIFTDDDALFISNLIFLQLSDDKPITGDDILKLPFDLLCLIPEYCTYDKNYDLAERILIYTERNARNIVDLHTCYRSWIEFSYRVRGVFPMAIDICMEYCKKDIRLFEQAYKEKHPNFYGLDYSLTIPSFKRLAIIHEIHGELQEAISVCELAISYNLEDATKGGFTGRLEKLKKKLKQF